MVYMCMLVYLINLVYKYLITKYTHVQIIQYQANNYYNQSLNIIAVFCLLYFLEV